MNKIIGNLLSLVARDTSKLETFLETSDFFQAPASTKFHSAYPGGLAFHSFLVTEILVRKCKNYKIAKEETAVVVGICHDLCKVNFYFEDVDIPSSAQIKYLMDLASKHNFELFDRILTNKQNASKTIEFLKNNMKGELNLQETSYKIEDSFPFGHGEKSAFIANRLLDLTEEEALAIRFHMGFYDKASHFENKFAINAAMNKYPIVKLACLSDEEASFLEDNYKVSEILDILGG